MFNPDRVLHCIASSVYATYNHMGSTQLLQCITLSVSKKIKGKGIFTFLKRYFQRRQVTLYGLLQVLIKLSRFKGFTNNFVSLNCFALFFVPLYYHIFMQLSSSYFNFFEKVFCYFSTTFNMIFSRCFKTSLCFLALSCLFVALYYHAFMQLSTTNLYFFQFIFYGCFSAFILSRLLYIIYFAFLFYGVYLGFKELLLLQCILYRVIGLY